jgi:hypothetical protein
MTDSIDALLVDLLHWLDASPREYADVMDAWRTSCPRLAVWEEAVDRGLVRREVGDASAGGTRVLLTDAGRQFLDSHRRSRRGDRKR